MRPAAEIIATIAVAIIVAHLVGEIEAVHARHAPGLTARWNFAGSLELLPIGHDDAIVVLCVLQIIFRQHPVARRLRIPRQRQIFFGDMRRGAANFYVGAV